MTTNTFSRVIHVNLFDLEIDKLRQLKRLSLGNTGSMFYPCRDIIAFKLGKKQLPKHTINDYKKSFVAYVMSENIIVSWALILKSNRSTIKFLCNFDKIKDVKSSYELHFYTKYSMRNLGIATKIAKSVKRKYPNMKFYSAYKRSSIFVKNDTLILKDKNTEACIKAKYTPLMS
jgi:hypothetical protein